MSALVLLPIPILAISADTDMPTLIRILLLAISMIAKSETSTWPNFYTGTPKPRLHKWILVPRQTFNGME